MPPLRCFRVLLIASLVLGFLAAGLAQQVVTTTTTRVTTIPGTTFTKVVTLPETIKTVTITEPSMKVVMIELRPNQECVIVMEATPVTVVTVPGITIPHSTIIYTVPAETYETVITLVEGGTTLTTSRFDTIEAVVSMGGGPITMVMTIPVPAYGEVMEYCERIVVTVRYSFEVGEPMTVTMVIPGFTMSGHVMTLPGTLLLTDVTTVTKTTTKPGTTFTTMFERSGAIKVKTITFTEKVETKTIRKPGKTITKTITRVITLPPTTQTNQKFTKPETVTKTAPPPLPKEELPTPLLIMVVAAALSLIHI